MSRSSKKHPFMACCGNASAKRDKQEAARGVRSRHRQAIRKALLEEEFDDFLLPHRLECTHNSVWGWVRDGKQHWQPRGRYNSWTGQYEIHMSEKREWLNVMGK